LRLVFEPQPSSGSAHPQHVVFVVTDAGTGRPLQALRLAC
jgi:hypothetical protein